MEVELALGDLERPGSGLPGLIFRDRGGVVELVLGPIEAVGGVGQATAQHSQGGREGAVEGANGGGRVGAGALELQLDAVGHVAGEGGRAGEGGGDPDRGGDVGVRGGKGRGHRRWQGPLGGPSELFEDNAGLAGLPCDALDFSAVGRSGKSTAGRIERDGENCLPAEGGDPPSV